ncbi:endonuclease domain-containing protein [Terrabacter sp. 2RAF25]|uniref:endonuclease domain-containing protein n=1 Tax=Terrabacter sp. 2RAF25 TaxID=3232998 RepID=UPI003F9BA1AE
MLGDRSLVDVRTRRPRGFPRQNKPACAFWSIPETIELGFHNSRLSAWQRGRCAICGERDRLVKDHDHDTAKVRGLLCSGCNTFEPFSSHPAIEAYRQGCNPAALIGHDEVYYSSVTGWAKPRDIEAELSNAHVELQRVEQARVNRLADGTATELDLALNKLMRSLDAGTDQK